MDLSYLVLFCLCVHSSLGDDPCVPNPCQNGGSCIPDGTRSTHQRCMCVRGYMGEQCHKGKHWSDGNW